MMQIQLSLILLFVVAVTSQDLFNLTIVTGMWNIGRGQFSTAQRSYESFYLSYFRELLQYRGKMIIFGSDVEHEYMRKHRPSELQAETLFIKKELSAFENYWYAKKIWEVIDKKTEASSFIKRTDLLHTPQYGIKMYNPVVMSKHRLMLEAARADPFSSEYFLWLDGGATHLMPFENLERGFFHKLVELYQPGWFLQTGPGFKFGSLKLGFKNGGAEYFPKNKRNRTQILGNWLGGRVEAAPTAYHIYENLLRITLERMDMNTDESIFILLAERYPFFFTSIENSQASDYFELSIKVEKRPLHDRLFKWSSLQGQQEKQVAPDVFLEPLVVTKLVEYEPH
jgi:hypothetical protein